MLPVSSIIPGAAPGATPSAQGMAPALIFVLAIAAAGGLILLLPGRREASFRKIGAVAMLAVGVIFAVLLGKSAAGMSAYFWIFASIAIIAAVRVVTHPKPVYSALYFVLTVMSTAGLFVLMWAALLILTLWWPQRGAATIKQIGKVRRH